MTGRTQNLSREDLWDQLRRGQISPVYVLSGAEAYLRDLAARTIADRAFDKDDLRDFNETDFSLNTPDNIRQAIAAAEQLPMMAKRRVVRILDVRVGATSARDTLKEEHENLLAGYLASPADSSVVIFVADELNGNRRITKLLRQHSCCVEFGRLTGEQFKKWAYDRVRELGSEIDPRSMDLLLSLVGDDVLRLTNEIRKLSTAALPERTITPDLIEDLVPDSRLIDNFGLAERLAAGDGRGALTLLNKILNDGAEPLMILGLISYNFRRMLMVKEMMDRGADRTAVSSVTRMRYDSEKDFLAAARRTDREKIEKIVTRLVDTDVGIKTSRGGSGPSGARLQIEMLVGELAAM